MAWGNAFLAGQVSLDEAAAAVAHPDETHRVVGVSDEPEPVIVAFGRLRGLGVTGLRLVLPVPGDPLGLPGPPAFNEHAVEAGEAVLTVGGEPLGIVPEVEPYGPVGDQGAYVTWRAEPVNPTWATPEPTLPEAEQELVEALRAATEELARLDLARWRPELAEALSAIRRHDGGVEKLPPGYPPRARRVLGLAERVGAIAALARQDEGAAVSVTEMAARAAVLRPVERSARRARVAAYNAVVR
ncbi:hypothetical protein LI90_2581 [Carbonactinospora thermoautotrophica]|uniref:Uncharacterized protein n=2 Tax=Carbonactinospora thermoautotrophica TaxID=1469144 RepID=A0A132MUN9_9ACTN|nr:hypothetical protein LI90_2581 [Carbonactinospora thermoautotrophica]